MVYDGRMATKKKPTKSAKPAKKPAAKQPPVRVAPPVHFDDVLDEPLVDASGTFRAVSAIAQAQIGHDEETSARFANESLVMRAQRDGFVETGPSLEDAAAEHVVDDEATSAQKRERLATLAALDEQRRNKSRR